ncbi:TRAF-like family protein [Corchorus olitorius]|uniref:TRAF-like family protein n=1 Tax=Corchorus olitorius TaxID=93759 RepID=A0A1R3HGP8_9ROSI|nr:TRAF-like family protein [Corchorus olitorius]
MAYESLQDFYPPTVLSSPGDGIVRSTTNIRRAQFSLKIDSYSVLCEKLEKYESNVFEADGYKWNLCFYPKGNSKSGGDGYISLYLKIAETSRFQCGWEILAEFKFSVFDQLRDNYLTIQEAGTVRRFQEIKTEWGMAKLLLLGIFKDVSNGYLVDDCCVFGVQISVVRQIGRMECFKLIKEPVNNIYTWEIENFSTLNQNSYYSEAFTVEGTTCHTLDQHSIGMGMDPLHFIGGSQRQVERLSCG